MTTLLINGKPAAIDVLIKFKNPPSWLGILLVVPVNKILLFSRDLITSLSVRAIPEPAIDEIPILISLPNKLSPASTRMFSFIF